MVQVTQYLASSAKAGEAVQTKKQAARTARRGAFRQASQGMARKIPLPSRLLGSLAQASPFGWAEKGNYLGFSPGSRCPRARCTPSISARVGPWHGCRQRIRYHPDTLPAGSRNYLDLNSAPPSSGAFCLCNFCVMCAGARLIMTERYRSRVRSYALRTQ